MNPQRLVNRHNIYLISIFTFALFIRIFDLGRRSFWWDEHTTILTTTLLVKSFFSFSFLHFLNICMNSLNSIVYIGSMYFWMKLMGGIKFISLEFIWRFPSVLWGIAGIFLTYLIAKILFDRKTAIISAFLLSLSAFHIYYSQEARAYTLLVFLVLITIYFLLKWINEKKEVYFYATLVCAILSILVHFLSILAFMACFVLFVFPRYRSLLRRYLFIIFTIISFSIISLFSQESFQEISLSVLPGHTHFFWIERPVLKSILYTLENFNVGYNAPSFLYRASDIIFFMLVFLGILTSKREKKNELFFIASLTLIPIFFLYCVSFIFPLYIDRYLIFCLPFYLILVSRGFSYLKRQHLFTVVFLCLSFILALSIFYYEKDYMAPYVISRESSHYMHHQGVHLKKPYANTAKYILRNVKKGDIIAFSNPNLYTLYIYYLNNARYSISKKLRLIYPAGERGQKFLFSYYEGLEKVVGTEMNGRSLIPIYEFILWRNLSEEDKIMRRYIWPERFGTPIYLDKGDLRKINFKRIWLLLASWNREGTDFNGLRVRDYLIRNEKLRIREKKNIDNIIIYLCEK